MAVPGCLAASCRTSPPASASGPAPRVRHPASPPRGPEPRALRHRPRAARGRGRCAVSGPSPASLRRSPAPAPARGPAPVSRAFTCAGSARGSLLALGHVPRNCHGDARRWPEALISLPLGGRRFRARSGCCECCAAEAGGSSVPASRSFLSAGLRAAASRSGRPPLSRPLSDDGCSPAAALWRVP